MLRVANAKQKPCRDPDPTLCIVYFNTWQSHELRVAIMRNCPKSGVKKTKRKKEQKKSDSI